MPRPEASTRRAESPARERLRGMSALLRSLFAEPSADAPDGPARGTVIGRFELIREIGRGGFGSIHEARDRELGRTVALKLLKAPSAGDEGARVPREAEAAARLSHPNIVTIHDVGVSEWGPYLVLELLEGETLEARLRRGPVELDEALRVGVEVASGLAHAHAHGVVHRDVTPANVFLCDDGRVKLLDLGMAHASGRRKLDGGTPAYMAPEQWAGAPEDERTDVFALGVVLYRTIAGELPFPEVRRGSARARRAAVRLDVPEIPALGALVVRMLQRDPTRRPRDAGEVLAALRTLEREVERGHARARPLAPARVRRLRRAVLVAAAVVGCAFLVGYAHHQARVRWALQVALPHVAELAEQGRYPEAVALASNLEEVVPDDAKLRKLWPEISRVVRIETVPPGARVRVREYSASGRWRDLGRSPVRRVRLPLVTHRVHLEKEGFAPLDVVPRQPFAEFGRVASAGASVVTLRFVLDRATDVPAEMVHVPGGTVHIEISGLERVAPVRLGDYFIDRTEVTNRQYKAFVDAGGYRRRELWRQPFVKEDRTLSWDTAMALFRDRTGRPGPATWISGEYPEGEGDLPVTGVSWYEAAAYAEFVGKALPSVFQWSRAAGTWASADILPFSNFGRHGLAAVGRSDAMGPFGTLDMAGNAKEWCWNATDAGYRFLLGGAWNEPTYMFNVPDAQSPFARGASYGFRLVKPVGSGTAGAASDPIPYATGDRAPRTPAGPDVYQALRRVYAYDKTPLEAAIETVDDTSERWRKEKVTFTAAYGHERMIAYVFTPRHGMPPFQTVVFFPGTSAVVSRSSDQLVLMRMVRPIVSSGRALVYPIYKSTYERGDGMLSTFPAPTAFYRDHVVDWAKDLERTIDYIETRSDLDARRIGLYGVSLGARLLPLFAAVEPRIQVGIMVGGGLSRHDSMPEADPFNFAPYVRQPVLMVNGRYDFLFPVETSQNPMFDLLGSPAHDKRHVVFDTGHTPPNDHLTREVLDWLDRYLGPTG